MKILFWALFVGSLLLTSCSKSDKKDYEENDSEYSRNIRKQTRDKSREDVADNSEIFFDDEDDEDEMVLEIEDFGEPEAQAIEEPEPKRHERAQAANDISKVQEVAVVEVETKEVQKNLSDEPINMAMVEQKPSFPGGDSEMYRWLGNNINFPPAAAEEGVSGKVTVQFVIEKDGSITNVKVVRGKHPALDAEAVRVVKKMPKWSPAKNNGATVRVTYMLPVTFKLQ